MSCIHSDKTKIPLKSRVEIPHPIFVWDDWLALLTPFATLADLFRETQKMRRETHRLRPYLDE